MIIIVGNRRVESELLVGGLVVELGVLLCQRWCLLATCGVFGGKETTKVWWAFFLSLVNSKIFFQKFMTLMWIQIGVTYGRSVHESSVGGKFLSALEGIFCYSLPKRKMWDVPVNFCHVEILISYSKSRVDGYFVHRRFLHLAQ